MAAEVDVRAVSYFASVPESSVTSLLNSPTTELVASLLNGIARKIKEYEQTKSQKVKLEVELETVVRTNESKTKVLQNSRDKALSESSKLRVELQTSGKPVGIRHEQQRLTKRLQKQPGRAWKQSLSNAALPHPTRTPSSPLSKHVSLPSKPQTETPWLF
jgi:hypothetical protein